MSLTKPDVSYCRLESVASLGAGNVLSEDEAGDNYLGQFIPLHYHHNMLMDPERMLGFKAAIERVVPDGARVLELGGGTGVLSCFAAARAARVWCVEFNPEMVAESRRVLALNPDGDKVEVVHANAFQYLPPEPVDVVICEMIHSAMLREKQVEVIESFKERYRRRFGERLPLFVPEAVVMAVQPVQQAYDFFGFHAPIVQFQQPGVLRPDTLEMAVPAVYSVLDFMQPVSRRIQWQGVFTVEQDGRINALRFLTKNILAVADGFRPGVDWITNHLVLPLAEPADVRAGDQVLASFSYLAGGSIESLARSMRLEVQRADSAMVA